MTKYFFKIKIIFSLLLLILAPRLDATEGLQPFGFIKTKNNKGFDFPPLSEIEPDYKEALQGAYREGGRVLNIGCGYGRSELDALKELYREDAKGQTCAPHPDFRLIMNDLSVEHLVGFFETAWVEFGEKFAKNHIIINEGDGISLLQHIKKKQKVIYSANVIHFFSPEQFSSFMNGVKRALGVSGKLILIAKSPYPSHPTLKYLKENFRYSGFALRSEKGKLDLISYTRAVLTKLFYEGRLNGERIEKPVFKYAAYEFEDYVREVLRKILEEGREEPSGTEKFPGWRLPSFEEGADRNLFTKIQLCELLCEEGFKVLKSIEFSGTWYPRYYKREQREFVGVIATLKAENPPKKWHPKIMRQSKLTEFFSYNRWS